MNLKGFSLGDVEDFCNHLKKVVARGATEGELNALIERFEDSIPKSYAQILVIPTTVEGKDGAMVQITGHMISKGAALEGFERGVEDYIHSMSKGRSRPSSDGPSLDDIHGLVDMLRNAVQHGKCPVCHPKDETANSPH